MMRLLAFALAATLLQSPEDLPRRRDALSARLQDLRGEKIGEPIPVEIGSKKEGAGLALDQARELYGGDLGGFERVLKALGLISPAMKLERAIPLFAAASMKSYAAGPVLRVLDPSLPDDELVYRLTLVLGSRLLAGAPPPGATFDARMARLAVQHGDADMTKQLFWAGLHVNGRRTDADTHVKRLVEGAEKWERETSGFIGLVAPRFLVRSSDFMWRRGGIFMESMRQDGGVGRLRYVYKHPPESTEQILHPEKYIRRERGTILEFPALETLMTGRKSARVFRTTLGELGTALLLESLNGGTKPEAPEGWGGDQLTAWAEGDRTLIVWAALWDEEKDAREFEEAASAAARALNGRDGAARAFVVRGNSAIVRDGSATAFVVNCPADLKDRVTQAILR